MSLALENIKDDFHHMHRYFDEEAKILHTIDTHTMGEPTRIIIEGLPEIPGESMMEKKKYLRQNLDWVRKVLIHEPRGHRDMFGAIMFNPCSDECDLGAVFMNNQDYLNMCGHGTIGIITAAINLGFVAPKEKIRLDTPAGIVECQVIYENNKVKQVSFNNVPSFLMMEDAAIHLDGIGSIRIDVAYGGNFVAIVSAEQLGFQLEQSEAKDLVDLGMKILSAVNNQLTIVHPLNSDISGVDLIQFSKNISGAENGSIYKNMVVNGDDHFDRSPCGTGTSARIAMLYHKGILEMKETFIHKSIINTEFYGKVVDTAIIGHLKGVIPQISGSAWITGLHSFVVEPDDILSDGFLVG